MNGSCWHAPWLLMGLQELPTASYSEAGLQLLCFFCLDCFHLWCSKSGRLKRHCSYQQETFTLICAWQLRGRKRRACCSTVRGVVLQLPVLSFQLSAPSGSSASASKNLFTQGRNLPRAAYDARQVWWAVFILGLHVGLTKALSSLHHN